MALLMLLWKIIICNNRFKRVEFINSFFYLLELCYNLSNYRYDAERKKLLNKQERLGMSVYLYYNRDARKLYKYGDVHYHSRRLRYLVIYVNKEDIVSVSKEIKHLKFVKDVRLSAIDDIDQDFVGNLYR